MKIQNEVKIYNERTYNITLNIAIINKKNQINRTSIINKTINNEKNDENNRIDMIKKRIKDIEVKKEDNILNKRNINNDIRYKMDLRQIIFKEFIDDIGRKSKNIKINNISINIASIINEFIIINIFLYGLLLFKLCKFYNILEFSRTIFVYISLIKNNYTLSYVSSFYYIYDYESIHFIMKYLSDTLFYAKQLMNKKLILKYIFLIDYINIFIFIIGIIIKSIKYKFIRLKIIKEDRKLKKRYQKNIGLLGINIISNLIRKIKKYNENYTIKLSEKVKVNRKKNIIKNDIIYNNCIILYFIKLLIIINILNPIENNKYNFFNFQYSKMTLKIKGVGKSIILRNEQGVTLNWVNYLKEVYINGKMQDIIAYEYYFNQTDNYVELIWDDNIDNCIKIFYECKNITEINLSNFNTSLVSTMLRMFAGCSSLTSLNLSNFDTFKVKSMDSMFYGCSSLTSLDLSNFYTSGVTTMYKMFFGCSSLTSLDLSNFNTSSVKDMSYMFYNCSSLTSLDLSNFDTSVI